MRSLVLVLFSNTIFPSATVRRKVLLSFSLGYYKNLGVIKDTDFDRFSARMNSDYKLIDDILTIGQHFTLNRTSEVQAPGGIIETALDIPSAIPVYASDGSWGGPVGGWPDRRNPRAVLEYNKDNRYTYWRMFGDAYVNLTPFKGFNLRSTFGLDYANKQARYFTYPYQEGTQTNNGKSAVEAKQEHWTKWMWNAIATYQLEVGKHRGDVMIGMELNREDDSHFSGYKEDFSILTPDYMWPDAGSGTAQAYGAGEGYSLVSFFGKMNYSYADRYLLSLTLRRDGSSQFGKNHRYATFPSVSLGWRITQENFMKELTWLDDLKLRASWGQTGNQKSPTLPVILSMHLTMVQPILSADRATVRHTISQVLTVAVYFLPVSNATRSVTTISNGKQRHRPMSVSTSACSSNHCTVHWNTTTRKQQIS